MGKMEFAILFRSPNFMLMWQCSRMPHLYYSHGPAFNNKGNHPNCKTGDRLGLMQSSLYIPLK